MSASAVAKEPLAFMTRLSRSVFLYRPPAGAVVPVAQPKLILLATWMGAADKHIAKHIQPYRELYPVSPILLVRSEARHFLRPGSSTDDIAPAATALKAEFAAIAGGDKGRRPAGPEMLVHAWSNGGVATLWHLRRMLADVPFPRYTLVIDSAPSKFHYSSSLAAFSQMIPQPWLRRLLSPLIHLMIMWFWLLQRIRPVGPLERAARSLNAPALAESEVRRTYAYSDTDKLIPPGDVHAHAAQARNNGFNVHMEKFDSTPHVAHSKFLPEKYWAMAKATWDGDFDGKTANGDAGIQNGGPKETVVAATATSDATPETTPEARAAA